MVSRLVRNNKKAGLTGPHSIFPLRYPMGYPLGRSENHKNELGICPECYYYVLVYYKTGFEENNWKKSF